MKTESFNHPTVRGFTLVELVTTLVILGILAAAAAPRFFDQQAFGQRGYVDELASTIRYAQRVAIASQCEVLVTINASDYNVMQQASINATTGACSGAWSRQVMRTDGSAVNGEAPDGVVIAPAVSFRFDASGQVIGAAPTLTSGAFALSVDLLSGFVTVTP